MTEEYVGTRFKVVFEGDACLDERAGELLEWAREFNENGLTPPYEYGGRKCSAGNLSYRYGNGFVITPSAKDLNELAAGDLVHVTACNQKEKTVKVKGKRNPSSEAMLHDAVYKRRPEANAVFHGHDETIIRNAGKPGAVTENEAPYGSLSLVEEVIKVLAGNNFIVMKNHGFLSLGKTMTEAGELALLKHKEAAKKPWKRNRQANYITTRKTGLSGNEKKDKSKEAKSR